jgi:hypothetical protein
LKRPATEVVQPEVIKEKKVEGEAAPLADAKGGKPDAKADAKAPAKPEAKAKPGKAEGKK